MENTIQALVEDLSSREHAVRSAATDTLVGLGPAAIDHLLPYTLDRRSSSPWRCVQSIIKCFGDDAPPRNPA
ncbi:hypothetical protein [Streptomyces sp. NPDC058954]|uniref:hypothetical protein n=1 Tax=Streptomyces sp. NPDC058954 TaxID=3346677 RepID=UPI0036879876